MADGRYLSRDDGRPERVLIVRTFGAPNPAAGRWRARRRAAKPVDPPAEPETVPVTRLTVADSEAFDNEAAAGAWLDQTSERPERRVAEARDALELINRALIALREAAEDPLIHELGASHALAIRIGYGSGEEVADGDWTEARQLPPPPAPRRANLDPQQQVAQFLAGTEPEED